MTWLPLSRLYLGRQKKQADLRLIMAYKNVFKSNNPDVQIVLADFASYCGFYWHNGPGTDPGDRAFSDGKRAAFGRLFHFLGYTDEDLAAMAYAATEELNSNSIE